jgi:diphthamide biosynthesis enzyme Dph1/Dph2-like protein
VPIDVSTIQMLYVFVDITIDTSHLVRALVAHFPVESRLILAGTIQFATAIATVAQELKSHFKEMLVPQTKPLSSQSSSACGMIERRTSACSARVSICAHFFLCAHVTLCESFSRPVEGEVLGCTSPKFDAYDAVMSVAKAGLCCWCAHCAALLTAVDALCRWLIDACLSVHVLP